MDGSMSLLRIALEDACQEDDCPICYVLWHREQDWLEMFLRERGADPGMAKLMRDSLGPCRHHAWAIAQREDLEGPLALVFVYDALLDYLVDSRQGGRGPFSRQSDPAGHLCRCLSKVTPGDHCPACVARLHNEDACIREFVRAMADDEMVRIYDASAGLCDVHLQRVLLEAQPTVKLHLLNAHMARLASVLTGLQHMERTSDFGDTEAVRRAVMLLVGRDQYAAQGEQPRRRSSEDAGLCVLCTAEQRAARDYLSELWQVKLTADMRPAWLCTQHAWEYERMAEERGVTKSFLGWLNAAVASVASRSGVDGDEAQVAVAAKPAPFGWLRQRQVVAAPQARRCPACAAMSAAAHVRTARLAEETVYFDICLRHASLIIQTLPERPPKLLGGLLAQLAQLHHDLQEYIRTRNWDYRLERTRANQHSWRRAIELFVGHEDRTEVGV